ncbi:hypothetical protein RF11_11373 [Thelohanellus kitauei]|uniref:39S ribosomal protein L54, mitochondrial n=1 Tax=Thelohanellus kitauei TaxID=669202 RepID=A0A0C2NEK0_THEKT|nr:hypothetical protein RF11_11373 [Thelohanellus kitauei]
MEIAYNLTRLFINPFKILHRNFSIRRSRKPILDTDVPRVKRISPFKKGADPLEKKEDEYPAWLFNLVDKRGRLNPRLDENGQPIIKKPKVQRPIPITAKYMRRLQKLNIRHRNQKNP